MRILLTGVNGQIGSALRSPLGSLGEVIGVDRRGLDLAKVDIIKNKLEIIRPDLIINPAAYTKVDAAEDEEKEAFSVNAKAPAVLAAWARGHDVPMVHFSTDYVYDGRGSRPWHESDYARPRSAYGRSKLAGDQAVLNSGAMHLIVRTSWIYAAEGQNFLRTIVRLALERDELKVVADQVGAPTSAAVVAATVIAILGSKSGNILRVFQDGCGIVHVACSGYATWNGFASAIVDGLRCRGVQVACKSIAAIVSEDFKTSAIRPKNSRLSLERLNRAFSIVPPAWQVALESELDRVASSVQSR